MLSENEQLLHRSTPSRRRPTPFHVTVIMCLLCVAGSAMHNGCGEYDEFIANSEAALAKFEKNSSFSGVLGVMKNSNVVYIKPMGIANRELRVPMDSDNVFEIGSNSKLFVAVALYQLQENALVNLSKPINDYLNQKDFEKFGFPNQTEWCPKLNGNDQCQNITFTQLLSMSSGITDTIACPSDTSCLPWFERPEWFIYQGSLAQYVKLFINNSLQFLPGQGYAYCNLCFILASYMVEKLSKMQFHDYLNKNVFTIANLRQPFASSFNGNEALIEMYTDSYFAAYENTTKLELTIGSCRPYWSLAALSGSGGLTSSVSDMLYWYDSLFSKKGSRLLSQESIDAILHPWMPLPKQKDAYYGQGIAVVYRNTSNKRPNEIKYCGATKCSLTCISMVRVGEEETILAAFTNHQLIQISATNLTLLKGHSLLSLLSKQIAYPLNAFYEQVFGLLKQLWL